MQDNGSPRAGMRAPDIFIIFLLLAVLAYLATFVFTPGRFEVAGDPARLVAGSFTAADGPMPAPIFGTGGAVGFLNFLFEGLISGSRTSAAIALSALVLVIGGAFGIIMKTGSVDRLLISALGEDGKSTSETMLIVLFVAFSLAGAVFGMSEEAIALTLMLAPALRKAGYDSLTALMVCFVATIVGFGSSWMNPFNVIVAQSIADVSALSGMPFRLAMWATFTTAGAVWIWRHARAVRLAPERSPTFAADELLRAQDRLVVHGRAGPGDWLILVAILAVVGWIGWGVVAQDYYFAELTAQFLALGLLAAGIALVFGLLPDMPEGRVNGLANAFREGAMQMVPLVLLIGMVKGILLMVGGDDPTAMSLLNSLLHLLSGIVTFLPQWLTAWGMLLSQSLINFAIPSGSGQAAVTMPIMAPLADLAGVTRQTAVLAFQLGDGITNLVIPTNAVLIGCLAAARVSLTAWLAFIWRPTLALFALGSVFVLVAHAIGYS